MTLHRSARRKETRIFGQDRVRCSQILNARGEGEQPSSSHPSQLARGMRSPGSQRAEVSRRAGWLEEFVAELLAFPGRHDDQVDALTQGLAWGRQQWSRKVIVSPLRGGY
jgi:hypothetical protein